MAASASTTRRTPSALGTVRQLKSGRWQAFHGHDGRTFTAPRTFATSAEANAWLATESADRTRGVWRDPEADRITLAAYAKDWLGSRPDLAPRTRDNYERHLRRWILPRIGQIGGSRGVELGTMDVADLTPAVIRAWYADLYPRPRERRQTACTGEGALDTSGAGVGDRSGGSLLRRPGAFPHR